MLTVSNVLPALVAEIRNLTSTCKGSIKLSYGRHVGVRVRYLKYLPYDLMVVDVILSLNRDLNSTYR